MNSPFRPLHQTLKACKCGFIGSRSKLYTHLKVSMLQFPSGQTGAERTDAWRRYFAEHGEIPHYEVNESH